MVDPVHQKMKCQEYGLIGKPLVDMEQESVQAVLQKCPYDVSNQEAN